MRSFAFLLSALVVAGCTSGGHHGALHSGDIAPGAEATLSFDHVGRVELHCHPHPDMLHNVTVVEGGAMEAHVHIWDGNETEEFRFDPTELEVGPGARVVYHNHGRFVHTASEMTPEMQH